MMDALNQLWLRVGDLLFGWAARISPDLAVLMLALSSALLLVGIRRFTTDQDLLGRCAADKRRLSVRLRESRRRRDRAELRRLRQLKARVALKQLRAEIRPLCWALLPLALLGTWAWQRLEFHGLQARQPFELTATFPLRAAGQLAWVSPVQGLKAETGWIQEIKAAEDQPSGQVSASWTLTLENPANLPLTLRWGENQFPHPIIVDGWRYGPISRQHAGEVATVIGLRRYHALGFLPNFQGLLPSWLIFYLVVAVPALAFFRRLFKVR